MISLGCDVKNCGYNDDHRCTRSEIKVLGETAKNEANTSCGSFNCDCGCRNATNGPREAVVIQCEAIHCMYNDGRACVAPHVDITGSNAEQINETKCSSFVARS